MKKEEGKKREMLPEASVFWLAILPYMEEGRGGEGDQLGQSVSVGQVEREKEGEILNLVWKKKDSFRFINIRK